MQSSTDHSTDHSTGQPQIVLDGNLPDSCGPVIVQVVRSNRSAPCSGTVPHYKNRKAAVFAGIQILLAAVSILVTALAIHYGHVRYHRISIKIDYNFKRYMDIAHYGYGFWTVIVWAVAGGLGVGAACSKHKCLILTHLLVSTFAAITLTWYLPLTWLQIAKGHKEYDYRVNDLQDIKLECPFYDTPTTTISYLSYRSRYFASGIECEAYVTDTLSALNDNANIRLPMDILLVLIGLAELVASVASAALCCHASCTSCHNAKDADAREDTITEVRYVVNQGTLQEVAQHNASGTLN